jgi:DNA-3-methyladenine glycosylase
LERDPVLVAEQLIGCHLVRHTEQGTIRVQITETEAYKGSDDPASHAFRGMTQRNRTMFGEAGHLYVYFIYGMHYCLNVVAHAPGVPGAVLVRAAKPVEGIDWIRANRQGVPDRNLLNGPGKLAQGLRVTKELDGYDVIGDPSRQLVLIEKETTVPVRRSARIGISAGTDLLWRFEAY